MEMTKKLNELAALMGKEPGELLAEYQKVENKFSDLTTWADSATKDEIIDCMQDLILVLPHLRDVEKSHNSAIDDLLTLLECLKSKKNTWIDSSKSI